MTTSSTTTFKYIIAASALVLMLIASSAFAAWAPAGTTPPNEPTGATPQANYYHPIVTTPAGAQEKVGKLGVGAAPATDYDFNVEGIGSFLGGVWASAGVFLNNVCIGTPIIATSFCPSGNNNSTLNVFGTFQSKGTSADIQNDKLRHTTTLANGQPGLERVCSTDTGILRLCDSTNAGVQGGGGATPVSGPTGGTVSGPATGSAPATGPTPSGTTGGTVSGPTSGSATNGGATGNTTTTATFGGSTSRN